METVEAIVLERRAAIVAPALSLGDSRRTSTNRRTASGTTTIDEDPATIAVGTLEAAGTTGGTGIAETVGPRSVTATEETTGRGLRGTRLAAPRTTTSAALTPADETPNRNGVFRPAVGRPRPRAPMLVKRTRTRIRGCVESYRHLVGPTETRSEVR